MSPALMAAVSCFLSASAIGLCGATARAQVAAGLRLPRWAPWACWVLAVGAAGLGAAILLTT